MKGYFVYDVCWAGVSALALFFVPLLYNPLQDVKASYPPWVAPIAGKLGNLTDKGFVLDELNIQVFEKKLKEVAAA